MLSIITLPAYSENHGTIFMILENSIGQDKGFRFLYFGFQYINLIYSE